MSSSSSSSAAALEAAGAGPPAAAGMDTEQKVGEDKDLNIVLHQQFTEEEVFVGDKYAESLKPVLIAGKMGFVGQRWTSIPFDYRTPYKSFIKSIDLSDPYWDTETGKKEREYYGDPAGGKILLENMKDPNKILLELTDLVTEVASPAVAQCLAKQGGIRGFFERGGAKEQCEVVLKEEDKLTTKPPCWICGYEVDITLKLGQAQLPEWYHPECEHVFPIAQAICFTGLYEGPLARRMRDTENLNETSSSSSSAAGAPARANDPFGITKNDYINALKVEYSWAHRICNQVKSDSHFIEYTTDQYGIGRFIISPNRIDEFLTKLLKNDNSWGSGTGDLYAAIKGKDPTIKEVTEWKTKRIAEIGKVCQTIIDLAAKSGLTPSEQSQVAAMSILSTISTSAECAGAVLAEPPVQPSPLRAVEPTTIFISFNSAKGLVIDTVRYFLQSVRLDMLIGNLGNLFESNRRAFPTELSGLHRDKIRAWLGSIAVPNDVGKNRRLVAMGNAIMGLIFSDGNIETLRYQVLQYSAELPNVKRDPRTHWSMFQVLFGQVVLAVLYTRFADNINQILLTVPHPDSMTSQDFQNILNAFLNAPSQPSLVMSVARQWSEEYVLPLKTLLTTLAESSPSEDQLRKLTNLTPTPTELTWFLPRNQEPTPSQVENAKSELLAPLPIVRQDTFPKIKRQLTDLRNYIENMIKQYPNNFDLINALNEIQNIAWVALYKGNFKLADETRERVAKKLNVYTGTGGRRTYRKPKRATSSLRTRRGRHSGLSKRLKKRSSRKSRTGKLMKKTRY